MPKDGELLCWWLLMCRVFLLLSFQLRPAGDQASTARALLQGLIIADQQVDVAQPGVAFLPPPNPTFAPPFYSLTTNTSRLWWGQTFT